MSARDRCVELAPHSKSGLLLESPVLLASGMIGYGDALPTDDLSFIGAWMTPPIGMRSHASGRPRRVVEIPGGIVWEESGPWVSFPGVLRRYAPLWDRLGRPVLARLWGPFDEQAEIAAQMTQIAPVAGIAVTPDEQLGADGAAELIRLVRRQAEKPLLVALPLASDTADWAIIAREAGADALIVGMPPLAQARDEDGSPVPGRLYGPAVWPLTMRALSAVSGLELDVPLVAAGGLHRPEDALEAFRLGASAVMIDTAIWVIPDLPERILRLWEDERNA